MPIAACHSAAVRSRPARAQAAARQPSRVRSSRRTDAGRPPIGWIAVTRPEPSGVKADTANRSDSTGTLTRPNSEPRPSRASSDMVPVRPPEATSRPSGFSAGAGIGSTRAGFGSIRVPVARSTIQAVPSAKRWSREAPS